MIDENYILTCKKDYYHKKELLAAKGSKWYILGMNDLNNTLTIVCYITKTRLAFYYKKAKNWKI